MISIESSNDIANNTPLIIIDLFIYLALMFVLEEFWGTDQIACHWLAHNTEWNLALGNYHSVMLAFGDKLNTFKISFLE